MRTPGHDFVLVLSWALAHAAVGCGTQVEVEPTRRGAVGESCEANDHCGSGLACLDYVCREQKGADAGLGGGGSDAGNMPSNRSAAGQSCGRRADCKAGLACVHWQCMEVGSETPSLLSGPTRGGRGESCQASNDCAGGLGCRGGVCKPRSLPVDELPNECFRAECTDDDDCCLDYVQEDPELCGDLDAGCTSGVASDCRLFESLCVCHRGCEEGACVAARECDTDPDCGASGVLRCVEGRCGQCSSDDECIESVCIGHFCRSQCERDEHCPLLHVCDDHRCVETGCDTDRECAFLTGNTDSRCLDGQCTTACDSDADCGGLEGCSDGTCGFVGCETNAECRIALGFLGGAGGSALAECRPPE